MIPENSHVVFVTPAGRHYIKKLENGGSWHSQDGILDYSVVMASDYGSIVRTSSDIPIRLERAALFDLLMGIKRQTQIIYPKDIAYICLKLSAGPGKTIIEAGCGSGALTLALSWFCGQEGRVYSHEAREEFARLARRNLDWAGLGKNVEISNVDIAEGFATANADAIFLDMREPWLHLDKALAAIKPGAPMGFLLPTTNQVAELLLGLEKIHAGEVEVLEILVRGWKPLPDRLRPQDRMSAHTGFLIFCRKQEYSQEFESYERLGTRERKQVAARQARNSAEPL